VVGNLLFRIEYERRGDRANEEETLSPIGFPQARQISYYFGVRAGGRLELEHDTLTQGWQRIDWNTVPQPLRESENRSAPSLAFRAVAPADVLKIHAKRHSLADALKLRVAEGTLTTVLSPTGDQLTSVDVIMEVIQRSSLSVGLPEGGELFSIFVNGESVNSIRQGGATNAWQFYILPGIDDRTAQVRFVYSVAGDRLSNLKLSSPQLNVPLENIQWNVIAPKGFELTDNDGNLELIRQTSQKNYDRDSYLSKASGKRQIHAQQATQLLEQANQLLQAGEQSKARWALNSVANQYALDAASNEDARVQLENLQTQQAIVGLNTRRQRLYLDNNRDDADVVDNEQLRQAAAENPVLQQDQLNFRPQELSQLLRGNTTADNAILQQIAGRLVQHQHTTEPAPQAIIISLPEEGDVYTFGRSVQVAENAPLELELDFGSKLRLHLWQTALVLSLLAGMGAALAFVTTRDEKPTNETSGAVQ
jgi:Nodulation protein S (NodS)